MKIEYKSAMCVVGAMWNIYSRIIRKGRDPSNIRHHGLDDNENRRPMLKQEELNRRSTCQQRTRIPAAHSKRRRDRGRGRRHRVKGDRHADAHVGHRHATVPGVNVYVHVSRINKRGEYGIQIYTLCKRKRNEKSGREQESQRRGSGKDEQCIMRRVSWNRNMSSNHKEEKREGMKRRQYMMSVEM